MTSKPTPCDNCGATKGYESYNGNSLCVVCRDVAPESEQNTPTQSDDQPPFIDPRDIQKTKLADGTIVTGSRKLVRMKKSRLGRSYNGKHRN